MSVDLQEEGGEAQGKPPEVHNLCRGPKDEKNLIRLCVCVR